MCGRYVFVPDIGWVNAMNEQKRSTFEPNYNVAPMQTMPVVTSDGIQMMQWSLVPSWSKEFKPAFTTINARSETAAEKPMFRGPFKNHRCLVPASGFYEWQKIGTTKQPYLFTVPNRSMFNFAGLYDVWYDPENQPHHSFTILTTTANTVMSDVHDRMPVILDPSEEHFWLDKEQPVDQLRLMLDPLPDDSLKRIKVSPDVGNTRNNRPDLLLELNSA